MARSCSATLKSLSTAALLGQAAMYLQKVAATEETQSATLFQRMRWTDKGTGM